MIFDERRLCSHPSGISSETDKEEKKTINTSVTTAKKGEHKNLNIAKIAKSTREPTIWVVS